MSTRKPRLRRAYPPGPAYLDLVLTLDERRRDLGWTHEQLCERAGLADRSWANILAPDGRSGRIARWSTLQPVFAALWPNGFRIRIETIEEPSPSAASSIFVTAPQQLAQT